jgi:hypothetical protein
MAARTSPRVTETIVFALAAVPQNLTHVAGLRRVPARRIRKGASISLTSVMTTSLSTGALPEPDARGHLLRVRAQSSHGLRISPPATREAGTCGLHRGARTIFPHSAKR